MTVISGRVCRKTKPRLDLQSKAIWLEWWNISVTKVKRHFFCSGIRTRGQLVPKDIRSFRHQNFILKLWFSNPVSGWTSKLIPRPKAIIFMNLITMKIESLLATFCTKNQRSSLPMFIWDNACPLTPKYPWSISWINPSDRGTEGERLPTLALAPSDFCNSSVSQTKNIGFKEFWLNWVCDQKPSFTRQMCTGRWHNQQPHWSKVFLMGFSSSSSNFSTEYERFEICIGLGLLHSNLVKQFTSLPIRFSLVLLW